MAYFKYVPYFFLLLAAIFLFDAIQKVRDGENAIISFLFVGIGIFMFFFRRWSYNRFHKRKE